MDTKDFICPPSLKFNKSDFEIGNAYGAVWGMNILAGELPDEILKDFLEMQNLFCVNIHVEPLDQIDALKFVKKKLTNVEQMKIDEQKKASQLAVVFSCEIKDVNSLVTKEHDTLMRLRSHGITDDMLEALANGEISINTNSEEDTNESKIF